jgi:hypothetical protein
MYLVVPELVPELSAKKGTTPGHVRFSKRGYADFQY